MTRKRFLYPALILLLAACANDQALREGERLIGEGKPEAGLLQLEQAQREHPGDIKYRAAYIRQKELHVARLLARAEAELQSGRLETAQTLFQEVLRWHPENQRAPAGLASIEQERRNRSLLEAAETALKQGHPDAARGKLRSILAQTPAHLPAQNLLKRIDDGKPGALDAPRLLANYQRPITLEFRDTPLKNVFDAIGRQSGLNFVFDKDVRTDQRTTILVRDTRISDAVDMVLTTNQLAGKTLNGNSLLIYPNQPQKQKEYQELVVRGFFLANADPKVVLNLLRNIAKIRDVHVDERLNMVMVRDTAESVRLAEKLVTMADRPEPEVMLEVEILEVTRSKLTELGVQWPNQFSVLSRETQSQVLGAGTTTAAQVDTKVNAPLTIQILKGIDASDILVSPIPTINLRADDGNVNLLANPRIRVKNKEKAKIHIGDKVPVITSNVTATGVTSESVNYLDVGLKLDVEPQVMLQGEVAMKVGLEVSNIVQQVKTATGTLTYQLGSRNASTSLRLKDGETQVLAGLISDQERANASKVPGLGDIPILGRLFSNNRDEGSKSEIVLLITPRILRNVERPELADLEFFAGTEASAGDTPLRLRPSAFQAASPIPEATEAEPPIQVNLAK